MTSLTNLSLLKPRCTLPSGSAPGARGRDHPLRKTREGLGGGSPFPTVTAAVTALAACPPRCWCAHRRQTTFSAAMVAGRNGFMQPTWPASDTAEVEGCGRQRSCEPTDGVPGGERAFHSPPAPFAQLGPAPRLCCSAGRRRGCRLIQPSPPRLPASASARGRTKEYGASWDQHRPRGLHCVVAPCDRRAPRTVDTCAPPCGRCRTGGG